MDKTYPNEYAGFNIKQSDGEAPVRGALGNIDYPVIDIDPRSTMPQRGST